MSKVHAFDERTREMPARLDVDKPLRDDYAHLPPDPQRVLLSPPKIEMMRTSVIKERPKDVILHTMKLTYRGWIWYITVRRTPLRSLYNAMAAHEYKAKGKKYKILHGGGMSKGRQSSHSGREVSVNHREASVFERSFGDGHGNNAINKSTSSRTRGSLFNSSSRSGEHDKNRDVHHFRRYRQIISRKMYKVDEESINHQKKVIKEYFEALLDDPTLRNMPELLETLELSPVSFDSSLGPSFKEGFIKARCSADTSDRLFKTDADRACLGNFCGEGGGVNCCCCVCFCFRKKATIKRRVRYWAVLKNSSLSFYDSRACQKLVNVISFQPSSVVSDALVSTGSRHGMVIVDTCWMAEMKCDTQIQQKQWVAMIKSAIVQCPWVEKDRFKYEPRNSGSLMTHGSMSSFAQWFITPRDLWENIHDSLLAAKRVVYIAGWWISPEIYLKRPNGKFPESRLDKVIEKIAKRGVKVYLLQYREPKVMPMKSDWTRECFLNLNDGHRNIQYLRHGDIAFPYMWSHHEKLVIIDQDLAYVGGVDLSLGRWDSPEYRLRDDGPPEEQLWLGKDYQNPRIKDYVDVNKAFEENPVTGTSRNNIPRMPRRDIHMRVFGQTALDVAWHFIQRWNYTRYVSGKNTRTDPLCIYGAGAAEMMASDHVEQISHIHDESGGDVHQGGSAGHFTNLIGKQNSRPNLDNTIASVGVDNGGGISPRLSFAGGEHLDQDDVISTYSEGKLSVSSTKLGITPSPRRPSIIENMKRRLSISPPTPADVQLASMSGPILKPESVHDEEWKGMSNAQRRNSIMGSTIEVNGQEVKVGDLQEQDGRAVVPLSYEEDNNNQRSRMIQNLSSQMASSGTSKLNVMGNVTERDAAFLPTLTAPTGPKAGRVRSSFVQKISSSQQAMDIARERRASQKMDMARKGDMEGITEEEGESEKNSKGASPQFKGRMKSIENESDEESSDNTEDDNNEFDSILGEEYAPNSDCTGNPYPVRCHLLRSLGRWSGGLLETEKGIQNAYKHFIESAQHYIYIENQFFVSGMRGNGRVTNSLAQCLYARIMKAAMSKSKFKVLVLIPLLPAMEGPVSGGALSSIAGVMYWQYRSICSGGNSLLENLTKSGVDWKKYIQFIGLRTHEKMSTGWQTEMIYIHSKLMIVDDRAAIIGSANFNDRSMVGNKDSEICILSEDTQFENGKMGNGPYRAGKFCKSLRMRCWAEFCGIDMEDTEGLKNIEDPSSDETWSYLKNLASANTVKYEKVFRDLVPSNRIKKGTDLIGTGTSSGEVKDSDFKRRMSMSPMEISMEDIMRLQDGNNGGQGPLKLRHDTLNMKSHSDTNKKKFINMLESVQGHIVEWPLEFMKEEFNTLHPTALPGEIFK